MKVEKETYEEVIKSISEIISDFSQEKQFKRPDISLSDEGKSKKEIVELLKAIGYYSPRVDGKKYLAQLFSGKKNIALISDMAASMLNIPCHTFKSSGIHIFIEQEVARFIGSKIGFKDGIMCPGGAISNLTAMIVACYDATKTKYS